MHFELASRLRCDIVATAGKISQVLFSCVMEMCLKPVNFTELLWKVV